MFENGFNLIFYILITYFVASIPFGYIIGKIFGKDVRKEGSGNIGATNVARTIGKKAGLLVLILDALKGFLPVFIAKNIVGFPDRYVALVALTAVIGHCFSIFMKFKGGKGVATGLGVMLAISFKATLLLIIFWLGVFLVSGYVSLASVLTAIISWIVFLAFTKNFFYGYIILISALIVIFKHASNIKRLFEGKEHNFLYKE